MSFLERGPFSPLLPNGSIIYTRDGVYFGKIPALKLVLIKELKTGGCCTKAHSLTTVMWNSLRVCHVNKLHKDEIQEGRDG